MQFRHGFLKFRIIALVFVATITLAVVRCYRNHGWSTSGGPPTASARSDQFSTLAQKISFLKKYFNPPGTYETLDFAINYRNGGDGILPSPSEWNVRIIATVPAGELDAWIPEDAEKLDKPPDAHRWLLNPTTPLDLSGVKEWYRKGGRMVGLDRANRIVDYGHLHD